MTLKGIKEMERSQKNGIADRDVRHFIYVHFAQTTRQPSTFETASDFYIQLGKPDKVSVASAPQRLG